MSNRYNILSSADINNIMNSVNSIFATDTEGVLSLDLKNLIAEIDGLIKEIILVEV